MESAKPQQVQLSEVADVRLGITFRGADAVRHDPEGTHQLIRIGDLSEDGVVSMSKPNLVKLDEISVERFALRAGEVLLAARGTRMSAAVYDGPIKAVAGSQFCVIRPHTDRLLASYLHWFLNLPATQEILNAKARGSYIKSLPVSSLAFLPIPLASLAHQRAIAELYALRLQEKNLMENLAARRAIFIDSLIVQSFNS